LTNGLQAHLDIARPAAAKTFPFKIRVATTAVELAELVAVRSQAYERHNAPGVANLKVAEKQDSAPDAILLTARSKIDNEILGSVRVQTRIVRPLMVESATILPVEVSKAAPVELLRGNVRNGGGGRMVSAGLAKASFQLCVECGFTHILVTCRQPVNLMYRAYQFDELLAGDLIDLPYSPGAKHKVLCLPVNEATHRWRDRNAGLHDFMINTAHPDIEIDYDLVRRRLKQAIAAGER
jgi:hypothetical protein